MPNSECNRRATGGATCPMKEWDGERLTEGRQRLTGAGWWPNITLYNLYPIGLE